MKRSFEQEILDGEGVHPETRALAHRALSRTHRLLGNHAAIVRALRNDSLPLRRVLDIGCGHGGLMKIVRHRLGVETVGVDLRPPPDGAGTIPILALDAVRDALPQADVAVSVCMAHHLHDDELVALVRNVGRSCRRFLILDLVRHPMPLAFFNALAPLFLPEVNILDGRQSIRRSCTAPEFRGLIAGALSGTAATFRHTVSPLWVRQVADIRY